MKRRQSARPVVVEIKRTRTSPSASPDSSRRLPPGNALWRSTPLREASADIAREQQQPSELDAKAVEPAPQPVRRILPSLTPMYEASDPQQDEHREELPTQRSRRAKSARKVQSSPVAHSDHKLIGVSTEAVPSQDAPSVLAEVASSCSEVPSEPSPPKQAVPPKEVGRERGHRGQTLRRGEFWKRRLPRACW